jgi:hypothetical protein
MYKIVRSLIKTVVVRRHIACLYYHQLTAVLFLAFGLLVVPPTDRGIVPSIRPACFTTYRPQDLFVLVPPDRNIVPCIRPACFTT